MSGVDADVPPPLRPLPALVALTGGKEAGKSVAAQALVDQVGFVSLALTEPLRQTLHQLDPSVGFGTRLSEVLDDLGWDGALADPTLGREVRRLLQNCGDGVRGQFGANILVFHLAGRIEARRDEAGQATVVVPDLRTPAEAAWVRASGGVVWEIRRPGRVHEAGQHHTEDPLPEAAIDTVFINDGDATVLAAAVVQHARATFTHLR